MTVTRFEATITPTTERLKGTLLDVVQVKDDFAFLDEHDLFDSFNCMAFGSAAAFCAPNSKTLDQTPAWESGVRFAVYGGVECKAVGLDIDRTEAEVRRAFEAGETRPVERALMETRFVADTEVPPRWAAATDVTPAAGAVRPAVGVALLEGHAASIYTAAPTLHMPRAVASLLVGVDGAVFEGSVLRTKLGSKIAAGGGYDLPNSGPTGAEPAAGEKWLYASGEVVLYRSDVEVRSVLDPETNTYFVLAERAYIAAVDCYTAAVRVKME